MKDTKPADTTRKKEIRLKDLEMAEKVKTVTKNQRVGTHWDCQMTRGKTGRWQLGLAETGLDDTGRVDHLTLLFFWQPPRHYLLVGDTSKSLGPAPCD
ncbi:hypothetical protein BaRGS_00013889 [Batillaria attramentaria]|uniref:Uncharacterized protein n=1 Tax=Batillaria attramentaria TaxID=370345 RepID=A0ABD0L5P8_9CAEN